MVPYRSTGVRLCFGLLAWLKTLWHPCLHENTMALSRSQFWCVFLEIENRFSIIFISMFFVFNFLWKWQLKIIALKITCDVNQKQSTDSYRFGPADHDYVHGLLFCGQSHMLFHQHFSKFKVWQIYRFFRLYIPLVFSTYFTCGQSCLWN